MRRLPQSAGSVALLAAVLLLTSACFKLPVVTLLHLRFLADGTAVARLEVEFSILKDHNEQLDRRIERLRRDLLDDSDEWSARFAALQPDASRLIVDRAEGDVHRFVRGAWIPDPDRVTSFFSDTDVGAEYTEGEGWAELSLLPGRSRRATRRQWEFLREHMDEWTEAVSGYLEETQQLYEHVDANPERSCPCFAYLFEDLIEDEQAPPACDEPLTESEDDMIGRIEDAMIEVLELFALPEDRAHTLEEISRLAYDPFPAPVVVEVPGEILEVEGFQQRGARLSVPGLSLWEAWRALHGEWLDPDPLVTFWRHDTGAAREPFSLTSFLAMPRHASPSPGRGAIADRIEEMLTPAPVYRVRWVLADDPPDTTLDQIWPKLGS